MEIYNEKVRDLLTEEMNEDQNLEIKLSSTNSQASKGGAADVCVPGLTVKIVENESQVIEIYLKIWFTVNFSFHTDRTADHLCRRQTSQSID